jgi:hypothetical protein
MYRDATALAEMGEWYTPWTWAKEFAEANAAQAKLDAQNRQVYTVTPIDLTRYKNEKLAPVPAEKALAERERSLTRIAAELAERERKQSGATPDQSMPQESKSATNVTPWLIGAALIGLAGYAALHLRRDF